MRNLAPSVCLNALVACSQAWAACIARDVAHSVVCLYVCDCLLVTNMSPAKMAELCKIKIPFGLKNHIYDEVHIDVTW